MNKSEKKHSQLDVGYLFYGVPSRLLATRKS